jgi:hypothetical protein
MYWPPLWFSGQSSWLQNRDALCFLWGTNLIYICYVEESRPTLWSCGQSSWLQIQRPGFDSRSYQIFREVVGLERGPLSFVSTTEELLGRKSSGSGLESREYGRRDSSRWPRDILYPKKLALTSLTSSGSSVGIVRSRTRGTEFSLVFRYKCTSCKASHAIGSNYGKYPPSSKQVTSGDKQQRGRIQNCWVSGLCPLPGILNN